MRKATLFLLAVAMFSIGYGQELYPWTEPASNVPAKSLSLKAMTIANGDVHSSRTVFRHMQDVTLGLSKTWMLRVGSGFANMHQPKTIWEGARLYTKWRFLSSDDVHKHFRMAAFAGGSYSRNHLDHNEINLLMGEQSGVYAGLVATQLWNRLAVSATGSWNEVLNEERWNKTEPQRYAGQAVNYTLSAGYLLLPREYKSYGQTNINLYVELLGSHVIGFAPEKYFVDIAPSAQAIFSSTAKLNVSHRFQLDSDIYRLATNSWMVSFEYIFLNALKRK